MNPTTFDTIILSSAVGAVVAVVLEIVKARITGGYWEAQERWKTKRDIYLRLLGSLRELAAVTDAQFDLEQQDSFYASQAEDKGEATPAWWDQYEVKRRTDLDARWKRGWSSFNEEQGCFPLVLRNETVEALRKLNRDLEKSQHPVESSEALWNAYKLVLGSAKEDLQLRHGVIRGLRDASRLRIHRLTGRV